MSPFNRKSLPFRADDVVTALAAGGSSERHVEVTCFICKQTDADPKIQILAQNSGGWKETVMPKVPANVFWQPRKKWSASPARSFFSLTAEPVLFESLDPFRELCRTMCSRKCKSNQLTKSGSSLSVSFPLTLKNSPSSFIHYMYVSMLQISLSHSPQ